MADGCVALSGTGIRALTWTKKPNTTFNRFCSRLSVHIHRAEGLMSRKIRPANSFSVPPRFRLRTSERSDRLGLGFALRARD